MTCTTSFDSDTVIHIVGDLDEAAATSICDALDGAPRRPGSRFEISLRDTAHARWNALCTIASRIGQEDSRGRTVRVVVTRPSVRDLFATLGLRDTIVTVPGAC